MSEPYTSGHFHADAQKQLAAAAATALAECKLGWEQVLPLLEAARSVCLDDIRFNGRLALHGLEGSDLKPADEAYLSLSASDRNDGKEWLSATYWLSDLALADRDPARVRAAVAALERTLDKLRSWLAEQDSAQVAGAADQSAPTPST